MSPTISSPPSLGVVRIDALSAALEKPGLNVQIDAILDAVKQSEEERDTKSAAPSAAAQRAALVKLSHEMRSPQRKVDALVHIHLRAQIIPQFRSQVERTQEAPQSHDGRGLPAWKTPSRPYTSVVVAARSGDTAVNRPGSCSVTATCAVRPMDDESDTPA